MIPVAVGERLQTSFKHPIPVFPLPDLVLFPHAVLPLHVYELRYRTLVRDALSRDRVILLALLKPGHEQDYQGSPEFHPLGCLARFEEVEYAARRPADKVPRERLAAEEHKLVVDSVPVAQHAGRAPRLPAVGEPQRAARTKRLFDYASDRNRDRNRGLTAMTLREISLCPLFR